MSLLNEGAESPVEESKEEEFKSNGVTGDSAWFWDENVPGAGARPDYLPDKYKTVAQMAKAQKELEKRLGSAPEKYDFSKGETWMEPEYQSFKELADYAKSKHVPQDVMDKMLESVGMYMDEFKIDLSAEMEKLGSNAKERLTVLNNWAKSNLSQNSFDVLTASLRTADQIEALEELRTKMLGSATMVPGGNAETQSPGLTLVEYRSELQANYEKYKTDPAYRKVMERKLQSIKGMDS